MPILKTPAEIEIMAEAGRRLASVVDCLKREARAGVTTIFLDKLARKLIRESGAEPAFLGYKPAGAVKPYPYAICASLNDVVVHGLPSDRALKDGDLLKIDLGLKYRGFYSDSAITIPIGNVGRAAEKLVRITREALDIGIAEARPGKTVGDIGYAIEKYVVSHKLSVVRSLTGHGIGRELHEEPQVLNFGRKGTGEELVAGMVLAIEPMVAMGSGATKQLADDSFVTADGSLTAHWEHTVAITEEGPRVLTRI
jgi:methionyl aminopeptidase